MVTKSTEYNIYSVTVPITLYVDAASSDRAVDVALEAISNPCNFAIVRNAEVDTANIKVQKTEVFSL